LRWFLFSYFIPLSLFFFFVFMFVVKRRRRCLAQALYNNSINSLIGARNQKQFFTHVVITKCIHVLLYGLQVCPLTSSELHSLDFAVTRFLMKLFKTSSIAVIKDYCRRFGFKLPSEVLEIRFMKFIEIFISPDNGSNVQQYSNKLN